MHTGWPSRATSPRPARYTTSSDTAMSGAAIFIEDGKDQSSVGYKAIQSTYSCARQ